MGVGRAVLSHFRALAVELRCEMMEANVRTEASDAIDFFTHAEEQINDVRFESVSAQMTVEVMQCFESCRTISYNVSNHTVQNTTCTYRSEWSTRKNPLLSPYDMKAAERSCYGLLSYSSWQTAPDSVLGSTDIYADRVQTSPPPTGQPFVLNQDLADQLTPETQVGSYFVSFTPTSHCAESFSSIGCARLTFYKNDATGVSVFTHVTNNGDTANQKTPSSWGCSSQLWQSMFQGEISFDDAVDRLNYSMTQWIASIIVVVCRVFLVGLAWFSAYCNKACNVGGLLAPQLKKSLSSANPNSSSLKKSK